MQDTLYFSLVKRMQDAKKLPGNLQFVAKVCSSIPRCRWRSIIQTFRAPIMYIHTELQQAQLLRSGRKGKSSRRAHS